MPKVTIKTISIKNFKNIGEYNHRFSERDVIRGVFGSGKTNIFRAYKWCLCSGSISPEVISNGNIVPNMKSEVTLVLLVDNRECTFYRSFTRTDGTCKNEYAFCGIAYSTEKEYRNIITNILGSGSVPLDILLDIKAFTSTSPRWTWTDQRRLLFDICNANDENERILSKPEYAQLFAVLGSYTPKDDADMASYLGKLHRQNKNDQEDKRKHITNLQNNLPSIPIALEEEKEKLAQANAKMQEIDGYEPMIKKLENRLSQIAFAKKQIETYKRQNEANKLSLVKLQSNIAKLSVAYSEAEDMAFDSNKCPLCGHDILESEKSDKIVSFENYKATRLADITEQLEAFNKSLEEMNNVISSIDANITEQEDLIKDLDEQGTTKQLDECKKKAEETQVLRFELEQAITECKKRISDYNLEQRYNEDIAKARAKLVELADTESEILLAISLAKKFAFEKANAITEVVNKNFDNVKFKFFGQNLNGSAYDTCEVMYHGVPFDSCSTGQKIAVGFYINQGLQRLLGISLPVWIDDVGSAKFFKAENQMIGLLTDNKVTLDITPVEVGI